MPTEVGAVLLELVSRAEVTVGVLADASTLGPPGLEQAPGVVCNPEDVLATGVTLWFVTDLPQLLHDRGDWLRRALDDLRTTDSHLVVVATGVEQQDLLSELGWSVESATVAYLRASADAPFLDSVLQTTETDVTRADLVVLRASGEAGQRPFLSVVMRTQGRKPAALVEALTALSAQTCDDFEVVLVGHDVDDDTAAGLRELTTQFPPAFADRVRVLTVHGGGRSAPLNAGFEVAAGRYLAMLDDDDVPFAHWVATFADQARDQPGRVVRSVTTVQATSLSEVNGRTGVRAEHGLVLPFPDHYQLAQHLVDNATPNMAVAVPRAAVHAYGMRVDDTLSTHEDWDFITRATNTFGTVSSPQCTALYRWWAGAESSRTVQSDADRERNIAEVHRRHEESGVLFHGTDLVELRQSLDELVTLRQDLEESAREHREQTDRLHAGFAVASAAREAALEARFQQLRDDFADRLQVQQTRNEDLAEQVRAQRTRFEAVVAVEQRRAREAEAETRARIELLRQLSAMLRSRRWRYSAGLRTVQRVRRGSGKLRIENVVGFSSRELRDVIYDVTRTLSWRLGERVLRTTRLLRPGR